MNSSECILKITDYGQEITEAISFCSNYIDKPTVMSMLALGLMVTGLTCAWWITRLIYN